MGDDTRDLSGSAYAQRIRDLRRGITPEQRKAEAEKAEAVRQKTVAIRQIQKRQHGKTAAALQEAIDEGKRGGKVGFFVHGLRGDTTDVGRFVDRFRSMLVGDGTSVIGVAPSGSTSVTWPDSSGSLTIESHRVNKRGRGYTKYWLDVLPPQILGDVLSRLHDELSGVPGEGVPYEDARDANPLWAAVDEWEKEEP